MAPLQRKSLQFYNTYRQFRLNDLNTGIINAEYAVRGLLPQTANLMEKCNYFTRNENRSLIPI